MTSNTAQLAAFASTLRFEDIPEPVVRKIEDLLVDWFGSAVAGHGSRPVESITRFAQAMGAGEPLHGELLAHLALAQQHGGTRLVVGADADGPAAAPGWAAVGAAGAALGAAAMPAYAQSMEGSTEMETGASSSVRHNASSFRMLDWQPYFANTSKGAILVDITSRALHFWSEDQSIYRLYPDCA